MTNARAGRKLERAVLMILLAAAVGAAVWAAGAMLLHLDDPVYRLGPARVAVVVAATLAVIVGAVALLRTQHTALPLHALIIGVGVVFALLAMSSVGFLALFLLAMFGVTLVRASRAGLMPSRNALGAAFLVTVGLAVILIAQPFTPTVRCLPNGVEHSSRPFEGDNGSMTGSGSATTGPGIGETGQVETGGVRYAYACRDGNLVDFRPMR